MRKVNIAVLVSGGGTNLQALISQSGKVLQSGEIALVVADRPCKAVDLAKQANIPAAIFGKDADFEEKALGILKEYEIELVVLAGFLSILSEKFIQTYENRVINVHPSLLPAFGGKGFYGLRVHEAALQRGVKLTGATVHLVNEIPDGGPILAQKCVPVLPDDTAETLQKRVMAQAEWVLLPRAVEAAAAAILKGEPIWI